MCLRDGEETVDDNEITKYNLFTKKIINSPSPNHSDYIKKGKKSVELKSYVYSSD